MAKKQVAEKELKAKEAELQGADARLNQKETIESEADSVSIEQIKSQLATPDQDFDWDADDKVFGNYNDEDRKKFEAMYTDTFNQITQDEIISGTVVSINNKDVVLNVRFKSDGVVSASEFRDLPELKIADSVDVFVE
ncbi:MAG: 30S ribosomal protein S1, partial [Pedobacter sp.]